MWTLLQKHLNIVNENLIIQTNIDKIKLILLSIFKLFNSSLFTIIIFAKTYMIQYIRLHP